MYMIEDLRIATRVLAGRKAADGTRLVVYPASRSVLLQAISEGVIATLAEAGAAVCAPGCGFWYRTDGCAWWWGGSLVYTEPELRGKAGVTALRDTYRRSRLPR